MKILEITPRQRQLLVDLVKTHIASAQPVPSAELVGKGILNCSPATVRNDLAVLEEAGFVAQPHTSAGRVPTEAGYRYYIQTLGNKSVLPAKFKNELETISRQLKNLDYNNQLRAFAKVGSDTVKSAAYVAFNPNDYYYTGLSALFSQPEFSNIQLVCSLAEVLDQLSGALNNMWHKVGDVDVHVGSDCLFGRDFATVVGRTKRGALFGLLGPQRLDYERSLEIVRHVIQF